MASRIVLTATNDRYPNDAAVAQTIACRCGRSRLKAEVEAPRQRVLAAPASRTSAHSPRSMAGLRKLVRHPRADHDAGPAIGAGTANRTRYSNSKVDAFAREALMQMDETKRSARLEKAIEVAMEDQAFIPVFYPIFDYAAKKGLKVTHRPERRFNR